MKQFRSACGVALAALTAAVVLAPCGAATARDYYTVGVITSTTGPAAAMGIPMMKGVETGMAYQSTIDGRKIKVIKLNGKGDPTTGDLDARKLIQEDNVDVILGGTDSPVNIAIAALATKNKTPQISLGYTHIPPDKDRSWVVDVPQPIPLMVDVVVEQMKKDGVKTVGYIGFAGPWGDEVYQALLASTKKYGIKVVANERYARSDSSVTGQVLKVMAKHPDAVMGGGAGVPGALPYLALAKYGYKGKIYGQHGLIGPSFVRVCGSACKGLIASTGPVMVANQLPMGNPIRSVAMNFKSLFAKVQGQPPTSAFSAYGFDAWLIFANAAKRVPAGIKPGTLEFRKALRDAIKSTHELVGTQGVYNFAPQKLFGEDRRAAVVVKLVDSKWQLVP